MDKVEAKNTTERRAIYCADTMCIIAHQWYKKEQSRKIEQLLNRPRGVEECDNSELKLFSQHGREVLVIKSSRTATKQTLVVRLSSQDRMFCEFGCRQILSLSDRTNRHRHPLMWFINQKERTKSNPLCSATGSALLDSAWIVPLWCGGSPWHQRRRQCRPQEHPRPERHSSWHWSSQQMPPL